MFELDLNEFWKADEEAQKDNCFNEKSPQVALGIRMSNECVFAELGEEGDPWANHFTPWHMELNKRYNDKAEKIVGKRLLAESYDMTDAFPEIKRIGEVFGGNYEYISKVGEWLSSSIKTPKELEIQLDKIDTMDIREFILPANWESEKKRIFEYLGKRPNVIRNVRGPVTLAMSIYGEENLIFLYYDAPELFKRFSDTIKKVLLEMCKIMDIEAGYNENNKPAGFGFADDNCALLSPEMYEIFGYPILKEVFDTYSPNINDRRYQHSDSEMSHLLPLLGKLNLTGCNFGPTVLVNKIRKYMKKPRIDGCIAPFTFMNNNYDEIIKEVKRDCKMIKATGTKGLNITTAGSINNGSSLESMKAIMWAINEYGQY